MIIVSSFTDVPPAGEADANGFGSVSTSRIITIIITIYKVHSVRRIRSCCYRCYSRAILIPFPFMPLLTSDAYGGGSRGFSNVLIIVVLPNHHLVSRFATGDVRDIR